MGRYSIGQPVRLSTGSIGVVLGTRAEAPEPQYRIFLDGRSEFFYESQLSPADLAETTTAVSADALRSRLTALRITGPVAGEALSLNEGRIDYIPYQYRPLLRLLRADRPRLLVADEVGVGKTIEAGLILRELHARRELRNVLVVCSKALVVEEKWHREMRRFDEEFTALDGTSLRHCLRQTDLDGVWPERYSRAILPFSLFTEELVVGQGKGARRVKGLLELSPPPVFDLVIVDEAHNARNPETWLHRGLRVLCEHSEAVLLLTATPIQLGSHELFHLLNLLRPDAVIDPATFERMAEPNPQVNAAVAAVRQAAPGWAEAATRELRRACGTPWGSRMLAPDPRLRSVLARLTAVSTDADRVRLVRDIEELHSFSHMINRTRRRDIGDFTVRRPRTEAVEFTPPQRALHDEVLRLQARLLAMRHGNAPVEFLMSTLRRQVASCVHGLAPLLDDILSRGLRALEAETGDQTEASDDDIRDLRGEIEDLVVSARRLPSDDPKLERLVSIAQEKLATANHRLLVFSTFRHTLAYLQAAMEHAGLRAATVHGGVDDEERRSLRRRFALPAEHPEAVHILLSSEVGSEGLDFQFCDGLVNYDIPWNPMRVEQRIGRIDRYGQVSESVAVWNLVVPGTVDFDIYQRCLLRIGVFSRAIGGCEEILGDIAREIRSVAEDMALGPEERRERLQQIADNNIRLLQEQVELERRQAELFGVRPVPGPDDPTDSVWLSPTALEHMVRAYLDELFPGRSSLVGTGLRKTLRLAADARRELLSRMGRVPAASLSDRRWASWLKGGDPTVEVTFDRAAAVKSESAMLLTAAHPLVRLAARHLSGGTGMRVQLHVQSASLPPGRYPFAIYRWSLTGIRRDARLVAVSPAPLASDDLLLLLADAHDVETDGHADGAAGALDVLHHQLWSQARVRHLEETAAATTFRRESFLASHSARMAALRQQEASSADPRLQRMRAAQLAAAEAEAERRLAEFASAEATADIMFQTVVHGTLEVMAP